MVQRLNWQKLARDSKPKRSLKDEREFYERDRAARWLDAVEQRQTRAEQRRARRSEQRQQLDGGAGPRPFADPQGSRRNRWPEQRREIEAEHRARQEAER